MCVCLSGTIWKISPLNFQNWLPHCQCRKQPFLLQKFNHSINFRCFAPEFLAFDLTSVNCPSRLLVKGRERLRKTETESDNHFLPHLLLNQLLTSEWRSSLSPSNPEPDTTIIITFSNFSIYSDIMHSDIQAVIYWKSCSIQSTSFPY